LPKKLDDNRVAIKQKDDKIDELMKHLKESDRKREESDKRHANMILRLEESNKRLEESNKRLGMKLDDVLDKNDELLEKNEAIETRVVSIQTKLDIAVEDRAPQPDRVEAREHFILLKRNDDDYPYYTIRAQETLSDDKNNCTTKRPSCSI
jgi:branched-subunit amino acid aminotransferase/4-amino-4-deoxychorismate lyase